MTTARGLAVSFTLIALAAVLLYLTLLLSSRTDDVTDAVIAHREVADFGRGIAGHERYDSAYVLAQKPRYIVLPGPEDPTSMAFVAAARDMVAQPEFLAHYEWTGLFYARTR